MILGKFKYLYRKQIFNRGGKIKKVVFLIIFITLATSTYATQSLRFFWQPIQQSYSVTKGGYVDISYSITNQENIPISCTVTTLDSSVTFNINGNNILTAYKRYNAPTKIKNLQNPFNYEVTIYCSGNYPIPYGCGFLGLNTCYNYEKREFQQKQSVQITLTLNEQDKRNLNILEDYRTSLSNEITEIDKKSQQINELLSKTPTQILPKNANDDNLNLQQGIVPVANRFKNTVNSLEQEDYGIGTTIDKLTDLNTLSSADTKLTSLIDSINVNIQKYNEIVTNLNNILSEIKTKTQNLDFKFNNDLISQLDNLEKTTYSQITSYQFKDLNDADNIVKIFSESKTNLYLQMENNLNSYSNKGLGLIKKSVNDICTKFNLCDTKNKNPNLDETKNFDVICNLYNSLLSEIRLYNDNELKRYNAELEDLDNKNKEIKVKNVAIQKEIDRLIKTNEIKENLNQEATKIEKNILDSIKQANLLGKNLDISQYSKKAQDFNNLTLEEKKIKIKELQEAAGEIKTQSNLIKSQQDGVLGFFKKAYYGVFGEKQKLEEKIQLELNLTLPKLIPQIPNNITIAKNIQIENEISTFFIDSCQSSSNKITELQANNMNIQLSDKQSQIKTNVQEAEKNCFDEKGQRTNKCCDTDDYKFRKDLYPVIFVHGHAFENGRGDIQNSISTFIYMSKYLSQNGYIEKSLLYPESSEQLTKGSWAFCDKPIVIRLTYYDGLVTGTTHNYKSGISDYSPILKNEIENVLKAANKDKAIIVAHSMGGILSRYYLKFDGGSNKIYKLITIASPHYGIRAWASFGADLGGAKESQQMKPNSDFLNLLNNPTDSLVPTYTISGQTVNSNTCFNAPCDGVIYVNSSKLKTASASMIFTGDQYDHNLIVNQPEVAKQVLTFIKN